MVAEQISNILDKIHDAETGVIPPELAWYKQVPKPMYRDWEPSNFDFDGNLVVEYQVRDGWGKITHEETFTVPKFFLTASTWQISRETRRIYYAAQHAEEKKLLTDLKTKRTNARKAIEVAEQNFALADEKVRAQEERLALLEGKSR